MKININSKALIQILIVLSVVITLSTSTNLNRRSKKVMPESSVVCCGYEFRSQHISGIQHILVDEKFCEQDNVFYLNPIMSSSISDENKCKLKN